MLKASVWALAAAAGAAFILIPPSSLAQQKDVPGVTATEITIGQTMPYSGPASSYGTIGKADAAYIAMINDQGGVNGRKIKLISLDDGYSPPRTVEQMRKARRGRQRPPRFQFIGNANQHGDPALSQ